MPGARGGVTMSRVAAMATRALGLVGHVAVARVLYERPRVEQGARLVLESLFGNTKVDTVNWVSSNFLLPGNKD